MPDQERDIEDDRIDPAILRAWEDLAAARMEDIRSGKAKTVPWSEVRKELWAVIEEATNR